MDIKNWRKPLEGWKCFYRRGITLPLLSTSTMQRLLKLLSGSAWEVSNVDRAPAAMGWTKSEQEDDPCTKEINEIKFN